MAAQDLPLVYQALLPAQQILGQGRHQEEECCQVPHCSLGNAFVWILVPYLLEDAQNWKGNKEQQQEWR